ncbi:MAG: SatD family protein [Gemmatimonadales bacterium]
MATAYYALIADLMGSRALAPAARRLLQNGLRDTMQEFNARWRKERSARFAITGGDELQGLLRSPRAVWDITHALRHRFRDADWVVAWGRGPVATRIPDGAAADELDGPCFHHARDALAAAKRERLILTFGGFDEPHLAAFARYYSALYWSWTARQRRAANSWRWHWDPTKASLTKRAKPRIHPSTVSHLRRRMAWPLVAEADRVFRDLLEAQ